MNIHTINAVDPLWLSVAAYADTCSWDACARMAAFMREGTFIVFELEKRPSFRVRIPNVKRQRHYFLDPLMVVSL